MSFTGATGLIKVVYATSGEEFATLVGHGIGLVNDLATHPLYPWILASTSIDCSIRIWDLRRTKAAGNNDRHQKPCIIICGHAQSHKEGLITMNWHSGGRYLIAGGYDHQIAIWTIPDLADTSTFWGEIANPRRSAERVRVLHYPHFISGAVHDNYVDHVQFYGDLILSKAVLDGSISIWKVEGFNSHREPPHDDAAPKTKEYLDTRSGFLPEARRSNHPQQNGTPAEANAHSALEPLWPVTPPPPWQRLLQLEIFDSEQEIPNLIYVRFGLFLPSPTFPKLPPILAFANHRASVLFWDLLALEQGYDSSDLIITASPSSAVAGAASADEVDRDLSQQTNGESHNTRGAGGKFSKSPRSKQDPILKLRKIPPAQRNRDKYPLHDPFDGIKPHMARKITGLHKAEAFTGRGVAWSADGKWCVVVGEYAGDLGKGDEATAAIFERDA